MWSRLAWSNCQGAQMQHQVAPARGGAARPQHRVLSLELFSQRCDLIWWRRKAARGLRSNQKKEGWRREEAMEEGRRKGDRKHGGRKDFLSIYYKGHYHDPNSRRQIQDGSINRTCWSEQIWDLGMKGWNFYTMEKWYAMQYTVLQHVKNILEGQFYTCHTSTGEVEAGGLKV